MKKIIVTMMTVTAIHILSPLPSYAASLQDTLTSVITQNPQILTQMVNLKKEWDEGNRDAVWSMLAGQMQERMGIENAALLGEGDWKQAMEAQLTDRVKAEIGDRVSTRIAPYQDQIQLVAKALNINSNILPQSGQDQEITDSYEQVMDLTATGYASGIENNGYSGDKTVTGTDVRKGIVAVDPQVIPMGTRVWVEGYGEAVAEDQGSAIKGDRIGLAFDSKEEALEYGMQKVKVYILE
ncbi:3D domain-containing protein [Acetonema longum]|uniref:3D domain protein n=1 Tax=Acetonema longum DSM 6540 TaxID=1009370 RepID=F7NNH9_9FIRM|nr:3D domain-containing protein [Acetonema longum]EGO62420.1 3D domain protein [Acetonema longum DSM 6540]